MLKFFRFGRPAAVLATGLTLLLTPARAQVLDASFTSPELRASSPNAKGNAVRVLATDAAGRVLVGGSFDLLDGQVRGKVARLLASGQPDLTFGASGVGANGVVNAIVPLPNGQYLIGGAFTRYDGQAVGRVARLNPDGSLDATFGMGSAGPDAQVQALAVDGQGRILVGGSFGRCGGQLRRGLARLLPTGAFDPSFVPAFAPTLAGGYLVVSSVAADATDRVLVAGHVHAFTTFSSPLLARLLPTGAADSTFAPGGFLPVRVLVVRVLTSGKIMVGGEGYYTGLVNWNVLRRLNADGSDDPSFFPPFDNGFVTDIVELPNQQLLVAGTLRFPGTSTNYSTARLRPTGVVDRTFVPPPANVNAIVPVAGGGTMIGGSFETVGGLPQVGLARLTRNGARDPSYTPPTLQPYATIKTLARQSNDRLLAIGDFSPIGAQPRPRIVRFTANGALDPTFQLSPTVADSLPLEDYLVNPPTIGQNDRVIIADARHAYRLLPDGALDPAFILGAGAGLVLLPVPGPGPPMWPVQLRGAREQPDGRLLVWGSFTHYNQVPRADIVRLLPSGAVDPSFVPTDTANAIHQVELLADGSMLLSTDFYGSCVLRWLDASGAPLASFNGGQPLVGAFARGVWSDTTALLAGQFTLNGTTYTGAYKVTPAGIVDPGFVLDSAAAVSVAPDTTGYPQPRGALFLLNGTLLHAGSAQARGLLRRLLPTGAVDPGFAPVEIGNGYETLRTAVFQSTGDLVLGGSFTTVGGGQRPSLARLTNIPTGLGADAAAGRGLDVFPNPAHATLTLRRAAAEPATATLVDVLGRPVRCWTLTAAETRLPLTGVTSGTYVVRVVGTAGVATCRVVVE